MSQNNLGIVLSVLGQQQEGTEALDEAVEAFRAALKVYTRASLPFDWANTQSNLGNTLRTLGESRDDVLAFEQAVQAHRGALEVHTRASLPRDWSVTQNNLGNALLGLGEREKGTVALAEAVDAYRLALEVRTRDSEPLEWAATTLSMLLARVLICERTGEYADWASLRKEAQAARKVLVDGKHPQWAKWGDKVIDEIDRAAATRKP